MAFKLPNKTSAAVSKVFNDLKDDLGYDMFADIFRCILTDNGSEFSSPDIIEDNGQWLDKSRVFYCNPNRSDQKAKISQGRRPRQYTGGIN
jgi:IS30 family transposase